MELQLDSNTENNKATEQTGGELVNPNDLGVYCNRFKTSNQQLKETGKIIEDTVKKYTAEEVLAVENAVKALNEKIEKIIEHPKMTEYKTKTENLQKDMFKSLEYVMKIFEKFRKKTIERKDITSEEKMKTIKLAFDKIQEQLFSKEEIEIFKQQFQNIITVIPRKTSYKNRRALEN